MGTISEFIVEARDEPEEVVPDDIFKITVRIDSYTIEEPKPEIIYEPKVEAPPVVVEEVKPPE